jgi:hypothetical protein
MSEGNEAMSSGHEEKHGHDGGHAHDEWFRHSRAEAVQLGHGDFNGIGIAVFLVAVIIMVFGIVFVFIGWFERSVATEEKIVKEGRTHVLAGPYNESIAKWEGELFGEPVWVDQDSVRLPLDAAINEVVKDYAKRR